VTDLYLVGTRLGAAVAALSAGRCENVAGIGLLFPVIDGNRYCRELLRQQQLQELAAGRKPLTQSQYTEILSDRGYLELESDRLSHEMIAELQDLDLGRTSRAFNGKVFWASLDSPGAPDEAAVKILQNYEQAGCRTHLWADESRDFWTQRSMYDAYVPSRTFAELSEWMG
jgi:hypothetical protein